MRSVSHPGHEPLDHGHHGVVTFAALAGSLVIAAVFGAIRAATVRVWVDGDKPGVRGTGLPRCSGSSRSALTSAPALCHFDRLSEPHSES